eukprot:scaffold3028_cov109-Skeletonema_marinoi.AAC.1
MNQAKNRGGRRHGARAPIKQKLCSSEGCTNIVVNGGVCVRHGAKRVEECVLSMEQRSNVAAAKDAQILPSKEECA